MKKQVFIIALTVLALPAVLMAPAGPRTSPRTVPAATSGTSSGTSSAVATGGFPLGTVIKKESDLIKATEGRHPSLLGGAAAGTHIVFDNDDSQPAYKMGREFIETGETTVQG